VELRITVPNYPANFLHTPNSPQPPAAPAKPGTHATVDSPNRRTALTGSARAGIVPFCQTRVPPPRTVRPLRLPRLKNAKYRRRVSACHKSISRPCKTGYQSLSSRKIIRPPVNKSGRIVRPHIGGGKGRSCFQYLPHRASASAPIWRNSAGCSRNMAMLWSMCCGTGLADRASPRATASIGSGSCARRRHDWGIGRRGIGCGHRPGAEALTACVKSCITTSNWIGRVARDVAQSCWSRTAAIRPRFFHSLQFRHHGHLP
jgi:hypothetical protein